LTVSCATERFCVIDDFLELAEFTTLISALEFLPYTDIHSGGWTKAFGAPTGPILRSELVIRGLREQTPDGMEAVGKFVEKVLAPDQASLSKYPFELEADRMALTGHAVLFGVNAGLNWHYDSGSLAGAYTYYAHPRWNTSWGGDLLLLREAGAGPSEHQDRGGRASSQTPVPTDVPMGERGPVLHLQDPAERRRMESGMGMFISARPNRLVLLSGDVEHTVTPVQWTAGGAMRATVTGFFHRPAQQL
jgi:hypothetical protein